MNIALLERLKTLIEAEHLPFATSLLAASPAPDTYVVATPLADMLEVFADGTPSVQVEEVRLSLFTRNNYLETRDRLTRVLLAANLTITGRRYIGLEADTGFHHYVIDVANCHCFSIERN